jgi:hypothetical protein
MRTWTNLPWPDDPYRTGQQLYRKPDSRLAAFTTWPAVIGGEPAPATTAIVYLPLHRSRPVTVTAQTLTFGFRAASTSDPADVPGVAAVADLDLMQARRHAAILAGCHLADSLTVLQRADSTAVWRGLAAVAGDWAARGPAPGRAALFDCDLDLPGGLALGQACQRAGISPMRTAAGRHEEWHPVTLAVERALAIALLCARHQGRYEWTGTLDTRALMAASAWDCLPWPEAAAAAARTSSGGPAPGGAGTVLAAAPGQRQ